MESSAKGTTRTPDGAPLDLAMRRGSKTRYVVGKPHIKLLVPEAHNGVEYEEE